MIKKKPLALAIGSIVLTMGYPAIAQTSDAGNVAAETADMQLQSNTIEVDPDAANESKSARSISLSLIHI